MIVRMPIALRPFGFAAACVCFGACRGADPAMNDKLMNAVNANDVDVVQMLLRQGAPVNARGSGEGADEGATALLSAVEQQSLPMARLLLRSGADANLPSGHQNLFPLLTAAKAGERDMIALLLDYRADVNQKRPGDGMDALAVACLEGHLPIVELLVARKAAVEPQDLSYAIGGGHVAVVRRLLEAGADPRWTFSGRTMAQAARESPARSRSDLLDLLKR